MRKLSRKLRNSQDAEFSPPTWDDPALNDSRPMDNQALSCLLHGGGVHSWMIISAAVVACSSAIIGLLRDSKYHR